ncbi:MAG TPA: TRIC cation channel family protein [Anaerolineales bacterium]|nr:TRIC cation channel family protein [Anaerolineales bacterium]
MAVETFQFPLFLEVIATIAWAVSGAIVARARNFDFTGVFVISVLAATGGGLIRDGIFLQRIPVMVTQPIYLVLPLLATLAISVFGRQWQRFEVWDTLVNGIDALGTPAFALIGFQLSLLAGIPVAGAMFIGLLNGAAGGILRDVMVGDVPRFFRPGQYSSFILIGALALYLALLAAGLQSDTAAWASILLASVTRLLVLRFNWQTRPVSEWDVERTLTNLPRHLGAPFARRRPGDPASAGSRDDPA